MKWTVTYDYAPSRKKQKLAKQKINLLLKERAQKMSNSLTKKPPVGRTFIVVVSPIWGFNVGDKFIVCKSSDTESYKNWNSKEDQKLTYIKYEKSGKPYEAFFGPSDYEIERFCKSAQRFWSHVKCDKHCVG